ncbi:MAG TPA: DNA repair protein RecO, partial [Ktedonobacterales bacterium]|nr:DNA repair protein RecO [Ktedonobacterales bacterium]
GKEVCMRRPHVYTTDALILKRMDYGEADRILTLFTPGRGKIKAIAKGARRTTSRIAGHVELFTRSQLQLSAGRDLEIVTQGESREHFPHLRAGLWHATTAFYLAELIDKFTDEHNEYAGLYMLLIESLRRLDEDAARIASHASNGHNGMGTLRETSAAYSANLAGDVAGVSSNGNGHAASPYRSRAWQMLRYFEIQLLDDLGYRPSLHECAACGSTLQPVENGFNPTLGGVLCPNCARYSQRPISLASLKVLRLLQTTSWDLLPRLRLDSSQQNEVEYLLQALIRFHLERDLKSWDFLRHIQPAQ